MTKILGLLALAALFACEQGKPPAATANESTQPVATPVQTPAPTDPVPEASPMKHGIHAMKVKTLEGQDADLGQYEGKVALVVNVASECGYTPQYKGLEALYSKYKAKGLVVLGFPSNDFGGQEPGSPEQIREFCTSKYSVDFPLFEKGGAKAGAEQQPVFQTLAKMTGESPKWNFGKYVVSKDGSRATFFGTKTPPDDPALLKTIEDELAR